MSYKFSFVILGGLLNLWPVYGRPQAPDNTDNARLFITDSSLVQTRTPLEYAWALGMYYNNVLIPIRRTNPTTKETFVSADSVVASVKQLARQWVSQLEGKSVRGLDSDAMARLYVAVHQDRDADREFAARLATKGLSFTDRAYTLLLAVRLYASPADTASMRRALHYMALLDVLPDEVVARCKGHLLLGEVYYATGHGPEAVAHLTKAIALVPAVPFQDRELVFTDAPLLMLADILSGVPGGLAKIDSIGKSLLRLAKADTLVARYPALTYTQASYLKQFAGTVHVSKLLGAPAPPIAAMYWYNAAVPSFGSTAAHGAMIKTLNDGKIRVLEFGDYDCPHCLEALAAMSHLHRSVDSTKVEVWYVTNTEGYWGATSYPPAGEAQHLRHFYVDTKHVDFPIALWAGPKDSTADGGVVPLENPSATAYPIQSFPTFVIVDGHGLVRHITIGYAGVVEHELWQGVQYLMGETQQTHGPSAQ